MSELAKSCAGILNAERVEWMVTDNVLDGGLSRDEIVELLESHELLRAKLAEAERAAAAARGYATTLESDLAQDDIIIEDAIDERDTLRARVAVLEGALRRIAVLQDEKSENWFASELATEALAALDPADTPCAVARPEKCRGCDRPAIGPHRFSCYAQGRQQIALPATVTADGVMRVDLPGEKEQSDGG